VHLHLFMVQDLVVQNDDRPAEKLTQSQSWNVDSEFIVLLIMAVSGNTVFTKCSCRYSVG
jgi:hypothetical protein